MFAAFTRRTLSNMPQPHFFLSLSLQIQWRRTERCWDRLNPFERKTTYMNSMWCWARTRTRRSSALPSHREIYWSWKCRTFSSSTPVNKVRCGCDIVSSDNFFPLSSIDLHGIVRCRWRCNRTPLVQLSADGDKFINTFHEFSSPPIG